MKLKDRGRQHIDILIAILKPRSAVVLSWAAGNERAPCAFYLHLAVFLKKKKEWAEKCKYDLCVCVCE